jgi:hypothetical protein
MCVCMSNILYFRSAILVPSYLTMTIHIVVHKIPIHKKLYDTRLYINRHSCLAQNSKNYLITEKKKEPGCWQPN